ncbi:MAG: hypothetical protein JWQ42_4510 [Edaphobacter sp.]|nr:hypothetical protein [Edaphobacter sp.]
MAIRRKKRYQGNEVVRPAPHVKSEALQENLERMRRLASASLTRQMTSGAQRQPVEPVYQSGSEGDLESVDDALPADQQQLDPEPEPASNLEQILGAASEHVLTAMQQAQSSIMSAEVALQTHEASTEERIVEAQRIAEQAVVNAISHSDAAIQAAMNMPMHSPTVPATPSPAAPEILSPDRSANSQVY